jgi:small subunit ribosomal protein S20
MAHTKSAAKRAKTSVIKREFNRGVKSEVSTAGKAFLSAIAAADKAKSEELYRSLASIVDKAAKRGVIGKNTADRRKARAAAKVTALAKA